MRRTWGPSASCRWRAPVVLMGRGPLCRAGRGRRCPRTTNDRTGSVLEVLSTIVGRPGARAACHHPGMTILVRAEIHGLAGRAGELRDVLAEHVAALR